MCRTMVLLTRRKAERQMARGTGLRVLVAVVGVGDAGWAVDLLGAVEHGRESRGTGEKGRRVADVSGQLRQGRPEPIGKVTVTLRCLTMSGYAA